MLGRLFLPILAVAACDWTQPDTGPRGPLPDAQSSTCGIGAFEIAAPRADLHYSPSLDVYIDESELQGELTFEMVDDLGASYTWTTESFAPYPADAGSWWSRDRFHYDLAASHRYTLTVSHCDVVQTVDFFTSP